jgi:hypothetical protein
MRRCARLTGFVLAVSLTAGASAESPCLRSGSGAVTVTGTLVQKVVGRGDTAQLRWMIRLETSMCVTGAPAEASDSPDVSDVRVVQLVAPVATMEKHFTLVGKRVTASGFVSTWQQAHEPAVVLLDVKSIEATP